ncbi:hypothetical protein ACWEQU_05745 [Streptomyces nodosus]
MIQRNNPTPYAKALDMELKELVRAAKASEYEEGLDLDNLSGIVDRKFLFMDMYDRGYITEDPTGERKRPASARNMPTDSLDDVEFASRNATLDALRCNGVAIAYGMDGEFGPYFAVRAFSTFAESKQLAKQLNDLRKTRVVAISDVMEVELILDRESRGFSPEPAPDDQKMVDTETGRSAFVYAFSCRPADED